MQRRSYIEAIVRSGGRLEQSSSHHNSRRMRHRMLEGQGQLWEDSSSSSKSLLRRLLPPPTTSHNNPHHRSQDRLCTATTFLLEVIRFHPFKKLSRWLRRDSSSHRSMLTWMDLIKTHLQMLSPLRPPRRMLTSKTN